MQGETIIYRHFGWRQR